MMHVVGPCFLFLDFPSGPKSVPFSEHRACQIRHSLRMREPVEFLRDNRHVTGSNHCGAVTNLWQASQTSDTSITSPHNTMRSKPRRGDDFACDTQRPNLGKTDCVGGRT